MDNATFSAASGLSTIQRILENSTYNTVNANTPGFQRHRVVVENFGAFVEDAGSTRDLIGPRELISFEQGTLQSTDLPWGVALDGQGFLVVQDDEGQKFYTRNGDLLPDAQGTLRTRSGYQVLNADQLPIQVNAFDGPVTIATDGAILQRGEEISRLQVVEFPEQERSSLQAVSETIFRAPSELTPQPALQTVVRHGYLEVPKYGGVQGMVEMLFAKKNHEAMQRALRALDESKEKLIGGVN